MSNVRFIFCFLFPIPLILCYFGANFIYDPAQLFHKPLFRETTFLKNMRLQAKGIIKNYDFNGFILGSSMLENTSAIEASALLGNKFVNISMSGSDFSERSVVLDYIFSKKPNAHIIYSLDGYHIVGASQQRLNYDYIYNDNLLDSMRAYINLKFFICLITLSENKQCVGEKDLENLLNWSLDSAIKARFGGFENWLAQAQHPQVKGALNAIKNAKPHIFSQTQNIDINNQQQILKKYIINIVAKNPKARFSFIIPTYSLIYYKLSQKEYFHIWSESLKYLIRELSAYNNAEIFGFDLENYGENIANYKDFEHYNIDLNSLQLQAIAQNTHILTIENMDLYFEKMMGKINAYDISVLQKQIAH